MYNIIVDQKKVIKYNFTLATVAWLFIQPGSSLDHIAKLNNVFKATREKFPMSFYYSTDLTN